MTDAQQSTTDATQDKGGFGRNQWIAILGGGIPMIMTAAMVWPGNRITGAEWIGFVQVYVPIWLGIVLGIAGGIKAVQAFKAQP